MHPIEKRYAKEKPTQLRRASKYSFELWDACRIDFVTGKGSLNWCANRHGISYGAVTQRAYREDWVAQRESWFQEKKLREAGPLIAAALRPPEHHAEIGKPLPSLSHDFFIHHANRHHAQLDKIERVLVDNWKMILKESENEVTIEQRSTLIKETRELILLQRKMLGIPDVAAIRQDAKIAKPKRQKDLNVQTVSEVEASTETPAPRGQAEPEGNPETPEIVEERVVYQGGD